LAQWEQQRRELCEVCIEMYRRGLVSAYSGNASLRLEETGREGLLLVTPTHHPYYRLQPEELVVVNLDGEPVGENRLKPSSETRLHLEIYQQRDDVAAVVHTHSIYASVAAVAGREIPPIIDEMIFTLGGSIRIGDYAFPGTQELALVAARALGDRNAALLRNHGVVGVGPNVWETLEVCDLVERLAQIFVLSQVLGPGGGNTLPPDIIELEQQLFQQNRRNSH
jgi:ribulose-5-phosphate 4-epimerase/fuculose-1-phosphate aldolase